MVEARFRGVLGALSRKREVGDRKPEARPTPSRREVGGSADNLFLKSPQTGEGPGIFFAREDEICGQGEFQKKETGEDRSISEGVLTRSFGAGRGGSLKNFFKPLQTGGSPGNVFVSQDKNMYQDGFQKKKTGRDKKHLRRGQKNKFGAR